jgi:hypothetical protein
VHNDIDHRCDILDRFEFSNQNRKNSKVNVCILQNMIVLLALHRESKAVECCIDDLQKQKRVNEKWNFE